MIGKMVTSFKCNFASYQSALEHLKNNKNGTINIIKDENGAEHYQWVGMYNQEYRIEIHRTFLESGIKLTGFDDVGLISTLGGRLMFVNNKIYTQPIGFSNKNEISSIYYTLKKVNCHFRDSVTGHSEIVYTDWRIPTSKELCDVYSTGVLPNKCYWFSNDIDTDITECNNSYSYCGSYIDFSSKKVGHVRYHEARNNAADMFFSASEDKGYNVKPLLIIVKDHPKSNSNSPEDDVF